MEKYSIYCTNEQTLKALKLGAPIECYVESDGVKFPKENPTAEQMIGFILYSVRGYSIDLAELIKKYGYKQGCLTFIENSLK